MIERRFANGQIEVDEIHARTVVSAAAFEELHGAFMTFCRSSAVECPEIAAFARARVCLSRIQTIFSRCELPYHASNIADYRMHALEDIILPGQSSHQFAAPAPITHKTAGSVISPIFLIIAYLMNARQSPESA
jgi:hypothetical protein